MRLVLVHLVLVDVKILVLLIVVVILGRVLLSGLSEVDHLATGATADDVLGVDFLKVVLLW